jgi:hypothetical protein
MGDLESEVTFVHPYKQEIYNYLLRMVPGFQPAKENIKSIYSSNQFRAQMKIKII